MSPYFLDWLIIHVHFVCLLKYISRKKHWPSPFSETRGKIVPYLMVDVVQSDRNLKYFGKHVCHWFLLKTRFLLWNFACKTFRWIWRLTHYISYLWHISGIIQTTKYHPPTHICMWYLTFELDRKKPHLFDIHLHLWCFQFIWNDNDDMFSSSFANISNLHILFT